MASSGVLSNMLCPIELAVAAAAVDETRTVSDDERAGRLSRTAFGLNRFSVIISRVRDNSIWFKIGHTGTNNDLSQE